MNIYLPDGGSPVIPNTIARIERRLPHPGEILVRQGSRVEPDDIIARALTPEAPQIINVARALGIPPSQVYRAMRREVMNKINAGEVLARTSGLMGQRCLAPVSGMISDIDSETGYVTIAPDPVEYALSATIRGVVMDVTPYEGVTIETPAAQVYGAFGIGDDRSGVLRLLAISPDQEVRPDQIDARSAYAILICGASISAAALRRAVAEQVRGVIVGGIEERELREFLNWSNSDAWRTGMHDWRWPAPQHTPDPKLTIIVTEGFGVRPMASPIFDLLSSQDRQEALIEGHTQLRRPMKRPRIVVPLTRSSPAAIENPRPQLQPGVKVRLLDHAHLGQIAQVRSVPSIARRIDTGARTMAVEVVTDEGKQIWLPRTCVEIVA